jgi:hypothetical protein
MPQYWVSIDYTGDSQDDYDWGSSYEYGSDDEADPQDDRVSSDDLLVEDSTFDTFDEQKDHQYRMLRRTVLRQQHSSLMERILHSVGSPYTREIIRREATAARLLEQTASCLRGRK